ncbi:hypothetical protein CI109_101300 [Kwoniella shandongensis]|uniref:protein-histidine N-methyltransferase n=1 Tax=Kwoniella shandongensis TaxID=1734106 RepID=A0A5M6BU31_9TREE|nr:uncharacterized protein CI109_005323 [Kwoniella shandongensis]KAA5526366.1 hypothetical protein CI109_005323 [Kwoniella shandongensis]
MFKFDFQVDEDEEIQIPTTQAAAGPSTIIPAVDTTDKQCHHLTLDELIKSLPEHISYSPLHHPSLQSPLLRRDLFDARFQLISSTEKARDDKEEEDVTRGEGEEYVDAKTDLIPGLYEGGLKTWEGGVDLVEVLAGVGEEKDVAEWVRGGRVLEVGCGTALPTAYLLRSILSLPPSTTHRTVLHLQDYNSLVLSLVTLPNLILASLPYLPSDLLHSPEDGEELIESVVPDLESPGNLTLTSELVQRFQALLDERGVDLKFTYGHWEGLSSELSQEGEVYGLVLTAETIYADESTPALISVLKAAVKSKASKEEEIVVREEVKLEDSLGNLSVKDEWAKVPLRERTEGGFALVAAKILYFGVGGGLQAFLDRIEGDGAHWSTVKEWIKGVGRKVVQVGW